jgi:hypothetical protein
MCASAVSAQEYQGSAELLRTPYLRSSQKAPFHAVSILENGCGQRLGAA